jgi:hypothetical protein
MQSSGTQNHGKPNPPEKTVAEGQERLAKGQDFMPLV